MLHEKNRQSLHLAVLYMPVLAGSFEQLGTTALRF